MLVKYIKLYQRNQEEDNNLCKILCNVYNEKMLKYLICERFKHRLVKQTHLKIIIIFK